MVSHSSNESVPSFSRDLRSSKGDSYPSIQKQHEGLSMNPIIFQLIERTDAPLIRNRWAEQKLKRTFLDYHWRAPGEEKRRLFDLRVTLLAEYADIRITDYLGHPVEQLLSKDFTNKSLEIDFEGYHSGLWMTRQNAASGFRSLCAGGRDQLVTLFSRWNRDTWSGRRCSLNLVGINTNLVKFLSTIWTALQFTYSRNDTI